MESETTQTFPETSVRRMYTSRGPSAPSAIIQPATVVSPTSTVIMSVKFKWLDSSMVAMPLVSEYARSRSTPREGEYLPPPLIVNSPEGGKESYKMVSEKISLTRPWLSTNHT